MSSSSRTSLGQERTTDIGLSRLSTRASEVDISFASELSSKSLETPIPSAAQSSDLLEATAPEDDAADVPPEGGFGWVVVACCSVAVFFFSGTSYSFGVIQAKLVADGVGSPSTLAFVGSLSSAALSIFAIPNSGLIRRFGAKRVLLAGGVITGVGEILAGFCVESIAGLFITAGLIVGLGFSMIYLPCSVIPAQYFVRKRGLAYGIVLSAGGVGGGVIALSLDLLLQKVGTAWCFRIMGLATMLFVVPAALIVKERPSRKSKTTIEWRLFKDLRFTTIWVASAIATFPLMVPPFFLPIFGRSIGLSSLSSAGLVSGFNLSSALGRILFGQLADWIGPVNALILAMLINALGMLVIWPVSDSLGPLIAFVILGGMTAGAFFSLMPTTVASLTEPAIMTAGFGLLVTGWGAGYLLGPPIAGYILQASGGPQGGLRAYRPALFYAGSITFASFLLVTAMKFKTSKSLRMKM